MHFSSNIDFGLEKDLTKDLLYCPKGQGSKGSKVLKDDFWIETEQTIS